MDKHRKKTTKMQEGPLKIYSDYELPEDEKDTKSGSGAYLSLFIITANSHHFNGKSTRRVPKRPRPRRLHPVFRGIYLADSQLIKC